MCTIILGKLTSLATLSCEDAMMLLVAAFAEGLQVFRRIVVTIFVTMVDDKVMSRTASFTGLLLRTSIRAYPILPLRVVLFHPKSAFAFFGLEFTEALSRTRTRRGKTTSYDLEQSTAELTSLREVLAVVTSHNGSPGAGSRAEAAVRAVTLSALERLSATLTGVCDHRWHTPSVAATAGKNKREI
jgi:hypothetical protein